MQALLVLTCNPKLLAGCAEEHAWSNLTLASAGTSPHGSGVACKIPLVDALLRADHNHSWPGSVGCIQSVVTRGDLLRKRSPNAAVLSASLVDWLKK